jgi:hypothetical protein
VGGEGVSFIEKEKGKKQKEQQVNVVDCLATDINSDALTCSSKQTSRMC